MEAGLPNITGRFLAAISSGNSKYAPTGAFYVQDPNGKKDGYGSSQYQQPFIGIDASRSNTTYGKSTTVTPLSLSAKIFIKY